MMNKVIHRDKDVMATIMKGVGYTQEYYPAFGHIRDGRGTIFMFMDSTGNGTWMDGLDRLGIKVEAKINNMGKGMKYLKRLTAPHPYVAEPGHMPSVRILEPVGKMTDGFGLFDLDYVKQFVPGVQLGWLLPMTYLGNAKTVNGTEAVYSKGFGLVVKDLNYDYIAYESKTEVLPKGGTTFMGCLYPAKGKEFVNSNIQSIANFNLERFVKDDGIAYLKEFSDNHDNTQFIKGKLGMITTDSSVDKSWALANAFDKLQSPLDYPAIVSRVIRHFIDGDAVDVRKLRIPTNKAVARYFTCDPTCFTSDGEFNASAGVLKPGEVFVGSEIVGDIAITRSPNARGEQWHANAVYNVELAELEGNALFYSGHDIAGAEAMHEVCGGSDNDDRIVVDYDPTIVAHMKAITSLKPGERNCSTPSTTEDLLASAGVSTAGWPMAALEALRNVKGHLDANRMSVLIKKMNQGSGIGKAVNALIGEAIIRNNWSDFAAVLGTDTDAALTALPNFWGDDLEEVIDTGINSGASGALDEKIDAFDAWMVDWKVTPDMLVGSDVRKNRLSKAVKEAVEAKEVRVVSTFMGSVQDSLTLEANTLRVKWTSMMLSNKFSLAPLGMAVPAHIKDFVSEVRGVWIAFWQDIDRDSMDKDDWNAYYKGACKAVATMLHTLETEEEKYAAIAWLYQGTYVRDISDEDRVLFAIGAKNFPDGLLWSSDVRENGTVVMTGFATYCVDMLCLAGEGFLRRPFTLLPEYRGNTRRGLNLQNLNDTVTVHRRIVRLAGKDIGWTSGVGNGTYKVVNGEIIVEKSFNKLIHTTARPSFNIVNGWYGKIRAGKATEADLAKWHELFDGQEATLVPTTFTTRTGAHEPAVQVIVGKKGIGWLDKTELGLVTKAIKVTLKTPLWSKYTFHAVVNS